jgi:hypothetical protein
MSHCSARVEAYTTAKNCSNAFVVSPFASMWFQIVLLSVVWEVGRRACRPAGDKWTAGQHEVQSICFRERLAGGKHDWKELGEEQDELEQ